MKSLAEYFPNTSAALEALLQNCAKPEKDLASLPTSDSQDQQGLHQEKYLVIARDFLMLLNKMPSGQMNVLSGF